VLVTGGGGFVGVALATALAARGDTVIAFDSSVTPALAAASAHGNIVVRRGDITDMANVCRVMRRDRPDAVVHCAAVVGVLACLGNPGNAIRVNVNGTVNLFEAMRQFDVTRVIHVSSEEVYGAFQAEVVTEDHPQNPLHPYGITKAAVEHLGRSYRLTHGLECINLRSSWIYGPGLPRMRVPRDIVEAAVDGRPLHIPAGGDSRIDHTYVDDFVDGALRALDLAEHPFDAYHVASGVAPTLSEMVACVNRLVPGAEVSIGPGTYRHADTVEMPRKGALDCARARAAFGYVPRYDPKAGLAAYIDHYRNRRQAASPGANP